MRDLGLTLEQFNAAGEEGKRAAGAGTVPPAPARLTAGVEVLATSTEQLYRAYLSEVGADGLQAVAYANGTFIIRTGGTNEPESGLQGLLAGGTQPKISPSDFVARYANVTLEEGGPMVSQQDFFGGQGYDVDTMTVCSAGFSAFSPAGEPVVLTAGHCASDGAAKLTEIALPAGEPAGGASVPRSPAGALGTFGFSQFGGANNSWITGNEANPGNVGTDIAVIESIRPDLNLEPAVTRWDDPANLGATAVKIIGTASPFPGQAVCRSGRTAGWSCGTVDEVGIYVARGHSGAPEDLRAFTGFLSYDVQSSGGDSGGPWISGNYAVGTHSAGEAQGAVKNFAVATTLEDALTRLPGVQLELFLNKPVIDSATPGGAVVAGEPIAGQVVAAPATAVPANSKVKITVAGQTPLEAPVDAAGRWSFSAPQAAGNFEFSAETVNGFSGSGVSSFALTVTAPPLPEPPLPEPIVPAPPSEPVVPPSAVTVLPVGDPAGDAVEYPASDAGVGSARLADTGASAVLPAAGIAGGAVLLGGLLLVLARRRFVSSSGPAAGW